MNAAETRDGHDHKKCDHCKHLEKEDKVKDATIQALSNQLAAHEAGRKNKKKRDPQCTCMSLARGPPHVAAADGVNVYEVRRRSTRFHSGRFFEVRPTARPGSRMTASNR